MQPQSWSSMQNFVSRVTGHSLVYELDTFLDSAGYSFVKRQMVAICKVHTSVLFYLTKVRGSCNNLCLGHGLQSPQILFFQMLTRSTLCDGMQLWDLQHSACLQIHLAVEYCADISAQVLDQYNCILQSIAIAMIWLSDSGKFMWVQLSMHCIFSSETVLLDLQNLLVVLPPIPGYHIYKLPKLLMLKSNTRAAWSYIY